MNLGQIRRLINFIAHKENGQYIRPADFQDALNMAQILEFQSLLPALKIANDKGSYEQNTQVMSILRVFKEPDKVLTIDAQGRTPYPDKYQYASSASREIILENKCATSGGPSTTRVPIRLLNDDSVARILSSKIKAPTYKRPYYCMYAGYMQFWPIDMQQAFFTYLRLPNDVVYAWTEVDGREEYDDAGSTQLEWPEISHNKIMLRAMQVIGINISEPLLLNFANMMEASV